MTAQFAPPAVAMPIRRRLGVVGSLLWRELNSALRTPGLYVLASVILAVVALDLRNVLATFQTESVMASGAPAGNSLGFAMALAAVATALHAAISVSSEHEHGTLEVLLAGPVGPFSLIIAKLGREAAVYAIAIACAVVQVQIVAMETNLVTDPVVYLRLAATFAFVLPVLGLALLVSSLLATARLSGVVFGLVLALFALVHFGSLWLAELAVRDAPLFLVYLRELALYLLPVLTWLSPVGYLDFGFRYVVGVATASPIPMIMGAAAYCLATILLAALAVRRRGGLSQ